MIRSVMLVAALGFAGLFGYYFLADNTGRPVGDKAADAVRHVGDKVRDEGVAGMIKVRLTSRFGMDATRFVHVHFDEGKVLVYGLAPAAITAEQLQSEAAQVPGVSSVEVLISARPAAFDVPAEPMAAPPADAPAKKKESRRP